MFSRQNLFLVLAVVALAAPATFQPDWKEKRKPRVPVLIATCSSTVVTHDLNKKLTTATKSIEACPEDQRDYEKAKAAGIVGPNPGRVRGH